jgi:hypothetical protein
MSRGNAKMGQPTLSQGAAFATRGQSGLSQFLSPTVPVGLSQFLSHRHSHTAPRKPRA